jgi:hypothetical protein
VSIALMAEFRASPGKAAVLLVGLAVLVVLVARVALKKPASARAAETSLAAAPALVASETPAGEALPAPMPRVPRPELARTLRRDLFAASWMQAVVAEAPSEAEPQEDAELVLQFTLVNGSGPPRAVISGVIVRPGSRIGPYVVQRIDRREVVLKDQVKEITLRMP